MKPNLHIHLALLGEELGMPIITHMGTNYYRHAVKLESHQHNGFELVFVLKGEQSYELENGTSLEVRGGQFSFMPSGVIHKGKGGYETPCQFCWMIFNPLAPQAMTGTPFSENELLEINRICSTHPTTVCDFNTNTRNALHRFRMGFYDHYGSTPSTLSIPLLRSLACELMVDSSHHLELINRTTTEDFTTTFIDYGKAAVEYIEDRVFESISVNHLAEFLGFSSSRTFEIFKQYTGQSPIDYQLRLRIKSAQEQLTTTQHTITQIAHHCGFSSSQYFARMFSRYVGKSPREFRSETR